MGVVDIIMSNDASHHVDNLLRMRSVNLEGRWSSNSVIVGSVFEVKTMY
jgi:hypothetical protein